MCCINVTRKHHSEQQTSGKFLSHCPALPPKVLLTTPFTINHFFLLRTHSFLRFVILGVTGSLISKLISELGCVSLFPLQEDLAEAVFPPCYFVNTWANP